MSNEETVISYHQQCARCGKPFTNRSVFAKHRAKCSTLLEEQMKQENQGEPMQQQQQQPEAMAMEQDDVPVHVEQHDAMVCFDRHESGGRRRRETDSPMEDGDGLPRRAKMLRVVPPNAAATVGALAESLVGLTSTFNAYMSEMACFHRETLDMQREHRQYMQMHLQRQMQLPTPAPAQAPAQAPAPARRRQYGQAPSKYASLQPPANQSQAQFAPPAYQSQFQFAPPANQFHAPPANQSQFQFAPPANQVDAPLHANHMSNPAMWTQPPAFDPRAGVAASNRLVSPPPTPQTPVEWLRQCVVGSSLDDELMVSFVRKHLGVGEVVKHVIMNGVNQCPCHRLPWFLQPARRNKVNLCAYNRESGWAPVTPDLLREIGAAIQTHVIGAMNAWRLRNYHDFLHKDGVSCKFNNALMKAITIRTHTDMLKNSLIQQLSDSR